jgi:hypothetical protein
MTSDYILLGHADIVTAFGDQTIGSKVTDHFGFTCMASEAIQGFDWDTCRQPGQAYIKLPDNACQYVSAGVGRRTHNPDDYVVRLHRDKVSLFLKREFAADVDNVAIVAYTTDAYLTDPDINEEEAKRVKKAGYTHMLVAVLASAGPPSPLTPNRFVHNLAGGNKEALVWTADEIREKAKEIKSYSIDWCVVAD